MKVLVTDGDYQQTLGIVRSLGRKGIQVAVVGTSFKGLASRSRYCYRTEIAPASSSPDFVDAVLGILSRGSYDLLIPVGYSATEALAFRRDDTERFTTLEIADQGRITLAANKRAACELAGRLEIPVPQSFYPATRKEVAEGIDALRFPVIIKPSQESAGVTVCRVTNARALSSTYRKLSEQWGCSEGNLPILQEYVPGHGCGFFALYQKGKCKRIFMHRRIRENPATGGASTCADSFYDSRLVDYGTRLLDHLEWHGVAMVEFRYDIRAKDYKLLEINPKFWGSLDLALAAGADFPFYLCQMAQGIQLEYSEDYRRNLRHHWPIPGEVRHVLQRPVSVGAILMDCVNPAVKSNVWMNDWRPNVHEGLRLLQTAWDRALGR